MNLELLESFGQNYPEENDGSLDCISMAITCAFNRLATSQVDLGMAQVDLNVTGAVLSIFQVVFNVTWD